MNGRDDSLFPGQAQSFTFDGDPLGHGRTNGSVVDDSTTSHTRTQTLCAKVARLLRSRPGEWIDGREIAEHGGRYAWRTRLSDLRREPWCLTIENRQRRERGYVVSEYRLVIDASDCDGGPDA